MGQPTNGGVMRHFQKASRIGLGAILLAGVASGALAQAPSPTASPDDRDAKIAKLEAEVQQLADEVQDLKRGQAAQIQTLATVQAQTPAKPSAVASISGGKPSIASADGQFTANVHAILQ